MKQIVSWIEKFGVTGYLNFEEDGTFKIADSDLKEKP